VCKRTVIHCAMSMGDLGVVRVAIAAALAIAMALATALTVQAARPARLLADFATTTAIIETSGLSCLGIDIYLADDPQQQARGLMRIEQLDAFEGMLFRYREPAAISMWMKNTYISLDMAFIRQDGRIAAIVQRTTPMSTTRITAPEPVTMVLELNAGFAEKHSLEIGDRLLAVD